MAAAREVVTMSPTTNIAGVCEELARPLQGCSGRVLSLFLSPSPMVRAELCTENTASQRPGYRQ